MLTPREKSPLRKMSPEEDRTRDAVNSEPKHYQLSYSGPQWSSKDCTALCPVATFCCPHFCWGGGGGLIFFEECIVRLQLYPEHSDEYTVQCPYCSGALRDRLSGVHFVVVH